MADILCPICKRTNDDTSERCWYCQAVLPKAEIPGNLENADWLASLRGDPNDKGSPDGSSDDGHNVNGEQTPEEIPDWLARIRTREQIEHKSIEGKSIDENAESENTELPDWLKEIKSGNSDQQSPPELEVGHNQSNITSPEIEPEIKAGAESSGQNANEDTDEWLNRLAAWKPGSAEADENPTSLTDNLPIKKQEDENRSPLIEEPVTEEEQSLTQFNKSDELEPLNESLEDFQNPTPVISDDEIPLKPEISTPQPESDLMNSDFLRNDLPPQEEKNQESLVSLELEADFSEPRTEQIDASTPSEAVEDTKPESIELSDFDSINDDSGTAEMITPSSNENLNSTVANDPFISDDLPDWLSSADDEIRQNKPTPSLQKNEDTVQSFSEELEPAKLPAWLQAMRPVEALPPAPFLDNIQEKSGSDGLLKDIEGTLQSTGSVETYRKPISYGSGLKVSEKQRENANLLSSLTEFTTLDDGKEAPENGQRKRVLFKVGLGILLISLAFIGSWLFKGLAVAPVLFPQEVVQVYDSVNSLPVEKPVLLVGDFEAGLAGELMWSSQTLIEHLMRRNIKVTILSSNPVGSAILSQQINNANLTVSAYLTQSNVINLGYLPGGAIGIRSLVTDLRLAMPYTQDLKPAWTNPILENVHTLNDFGAVIIFTEKAENARNWVEQVQPNLTVAPLFFVVSAQAAPMIQPYFQSGQVNGYIAGLNGSLAYEQIMQQPGVSMLHLGTYQLVVLMVAALLLIGIL